MLDQDRLSAKIQAAFEAYNDVDMDTAAIAAARIQIPKDLAKAIVEEIQFAKVTVPGTGMTSATGGLVSGTSVTGNLS